MVLRVEGQGRWPRMQFDRERRTFGQRGWRCLLVCFLVGGWACLTAQPCSLANEPIEVLAAAPVQLPPSTAAQSPFPFTAPPIQLTDGRWVGCQAAARWKPAQLLRSRARTLVQLYADQDPLACSAAHTVACGLQLQAAGQEDVAAASGMRAYYALLAIAEQRALLGQAEELNQTQLDKQTALRGSGLASATDMSAFERRRLKIRDQALQLTAEERQLRSLLARHTGLDFEDPLLNLERLELQACPLDCQALQQLALAQRADLGAWRHLTRRTHGDNAAEIAKLLPTLAGGWTIPLPEISRLKRLLGHQDDGVLTVHLERELELILSVQIDTVCQSIESSTAQLEINYQRIELARQLVASWQNRIQQLDRLDDQGAGKPELRAEAQSELIQAQADEVQRRLDARLAEIELAEACGGLAGRCCQGLAWLQTGCY